MISILLARLKQKHRTLAYPKGPAPDMPDRFRGRPALGRKPVRAGAAAACPAGALTPSGRGLTASLDMGKCLFCGECADAGVRFTRDFQLAGLTRESLVVRPGDAGAPDVSSNASRKRFGGSLVLRQVSAGGCNACEADVNVLNTVAWDLGRFGISFTASPRHADGLLVTGPVTRNMRLALEKTYLAVPAPKIVIAVGACACSGGLFRGLPEVSSGADALLPVDLYIPGCPPHPLTLLDALLRFLGKA